MALHRIGVVLSQDGELLLGPKSLSRPGKACARMKYSCRRCGIYSRALIARKDQGYIQNRAIKFTKSALGSALGLNGQIATKALILFNKTHCPGGAEGSRTPDLVIANDALYQLSYGPDRQAGAEISGASGGCQRVAEESLAFDAGAARSERVSREFSQWASAPASSASSSF